MEKRVNLQNAPWVKGWKSLETNCVEVATAADGSGVGVRDSKNPDGPKLTFTPGEWTAFVESAKTGQFDL